MKSILKRIALSAAASELLDQATGGQLARHHGDYIGAILRQRRAAWVQALDTLLEGTTRRRLAAALASVETIDPGPEDRCEPRPSFVRAIASLKLPASGCRAINAFLDLLLEYNAGNRALRTALDKET